MIRPALMAWALSACAVPAAAQTVEFIPRVQFHLTAEHLSSDDARFIWDTNFGGELDLVDYGAGRVGIAANYQAVLGNELRVFDPNQGNYVLEASASARLPGVEVAGVFYHQSRHLSDRAKQIPVDWNMIAVRLRRTFDVRSSRLDARADVRRSVKKSSIDYDWEIDARTDARVPVRGRIAVIAAGGLRVLGVDGTAGRGTQTGLRGEGGVRFEGNAGAVELYVAAERRVDPYPLQFSTATWASAGFRLLSR